MGATRASIMFSPIARKTLDGEPGSTAAEAAEIAD
jgi:hypothetical protein